MSAKLPTLPSLPAPRARALMLLADPESDFREIASVIESDPALTVVLLRAANSAASASLKRIESAQQAVVRLGMWPTRQVVATAVVGSTFHQLERAQLDVDGLWRHLVATALLADASLREVQRGSAFTAGLLHDVGRLAMATADPERYADVVTRARAGLDTAATEVELFGTDHARFGYRIARQWDLPDSIAEAIRDHHGTSESPLTASVQRALRISHALGFGNGVTTGTRRSSIPTPRTARSCAASADLASSRRASSGIGARSRAAPQGRGLKPPSCRRRSPA